LAGATLVDCNAPGSNCASPYKQKADAVGGFTGSWAWCKVTKGAATVYRWADTPPAASSAGGWGGWASTTDTVTNQPTAAQILQYRKDNAICVAWNSFLNGAVMTLNVGSEVACGTGAPVKKVQCNTTKVCKNEMDWPGGKPQIAVTNFNGTSKSTPYNAPKGLDPCL
jgi:hypothetical protein